MKQRDKSIFHISCNFVSVTFFYTMVKNRHSLFLFLFFFWVYFLSSLLYIPKQTKININNMEVISLFSATQQCYRFLMKGLLFFIKLDDGYLNILIVTALLVMMVQFKHYYLKKRMVRWKCFIAKSSQTWRRSLAWFVGNSRSTIKECVFLCFITTKFCRVSCPYSLLYYSTR